MEVSFRKPSTQGKVYVATFAVGFIAEFVGEVLLYRTIPEDRENLKARFWARYVMGAAFASIVGVIGYIVVEVLVGSGWPKMAWVLAFMPTLAVIATTFTLQGVNTIMDSTSGTSCVGMIGSALSQSGRKQRTKQKKVCDTHKQTKSA